VRRGVARPASCSLWAPPTPRPPRSSAIWPTACAARSETLLADRGTDLPARLRDALIGLTDALVEQTAGGATVIALDTPPARAWRAHPAGRGR
jgi:hypothetical protein